MKRMVWTEPAKADVRRLDKPTAMRIFAALLTPSKFAASAEGAKELSPALYRWEDESGNPECRRHGRIDVCRPNGTRIFFLSLSQR